jgi:hypothetical protein
MEIVNRAACGTTYCSPPQLSTLQIIPVVLLSALVLVSADILSLPLSQGKEKEKGKEVKAKKKASKVKKRRVFH